MKLTVQDRFELANLFPAKSDRITQHLVKDIDNKIKLSHEDLKKINFRSDSNRPGYNIWDNKIEEKDIDFAEAELVLIKGWAKEANDRKIVTQSNLSLLDKIEEEKIPKNRRR